jgi:hypothetical protein
MKKTNLKEKLFSMLLVNKRKQKRPSSFTKEESTFDDPDADFLN